jgi:hypothetical protein
MVFLATPQTHLKGKAGGYRYQVEDLRREPHGRLVFLTARVGLVDLNTGRPHRFCFAALHMGGMDFTANVTADPGPETFQKALIACGNISIPCPSRGSSG